MSAIAVRWHPLGAEGRAGIPILDLVGVRLRATAPWLSVFLAVPIVLVFALRPRTEDTGERMAGLLIGCAIGLAAWVIAALATDRSVLPQRANPRQFRDLQWRIGELGRAMDGVALAWADADLRRLRGEYESLHGDFERPEADAGWSTGINYVLAWIRLHRLEEAMIRYTDDTRLGEVLAHDAGRVEGSRLYRKGSTLRDEMDDAAKMLGTRPADERLRPLLARIRLTVNDYRDRRFEALIAGREQIDEKTTTLGIVACALLCLAILFHASIEAVVSIGAYYLIGVGAALFTQLRKDGTNDALVEVFGYGKAHLRETMLVSGIAAATGVMLLPVMAAGATGLPLDDLMTSVVASPANYLVAAAFGLAPGLLLDRMNAWAKANITELEATQKGETGDTTAKDG